MKKKDQITSRIWDHQEQGTKEKKIQLIKRGRVLIELGTINNWEQNDRLPNGSLGHPSVEALDYSP